jgi:2-polyprenyl-6-methoxyphenol hydroxylase-like FAD-dependent oxidoreductase
VFLQAAPPARTRAGVLVPVKGNRWIVTLGGGDRDYPPTDEVGFLDFARSLPSPMLYNAIKDAVPLSPIYANRSTENRLRHYERLPRWPERFLVMGDAVCAFNPVYGQGMTTAALSALALDQCLHSQYRHQLECDLTGLARRFQQRLIKVNAAAWMLATSEDYRYRGTEGGMPDWTTRLMHWYIDQVLKLATKNVHVRKLFLEVQQMLRSPIALFQAGVILPMLWRMLRRPPRRRAELTRPFAGPLGLSVHSAGHKGQRRNTQQSSEILPF